VADKVILSPSVDWNENNRGVAKTVMKPINFNPNWSSDFTGSPDSAKQQGNIPIIVADDNDAPRLAITSALDTWGFRYTAYNSGPAAMEALRSIRGSALVILDWMMPELDGLEICRRIRDAQKPMHIILVTARGGSGNLIEGLKAGADEYLVKPFDLDELRARIQVGLRVLSLQSALAERVNELEAALRENQNLKQKFNIPI
jgi:phosphoserine phosphatase RsbU/P